MLSYRTILHPIFKFQRETPNFSVTAEYSSRRIRRICRTHRLGTPVFLISFTKPASQKGKTGYGLIRLCLIPAPPSTPMTFGVTRAWETTRLETYIKASNRSRHVPRMNDRRSQSDHYAPRTASDPSHAHPSLTLSFSLCIGYSTLSTPTSYPV